ncbi:MULTISPECIES: MFS transporter [Thermoactinomyces]|uniref:MFS transporter n=1 Tax=Thermoactinomyces daqus TaxID=1329516 RepID=A0A7W1X7J9_9BACL|nr:MULTISPECIES: MFS transporter [Thermoactinomyces]MBA4541511.1 MFS transporter [Thermoactinomyces daqus]MBH8607602.1 MFS transporter [Thermoactinomyces sp. CICC 10521]
MNGKKPNRLLFLIAIASGTLLNPLNSSMISMALHRIQQDFHLSFTTVSWLISSYYLASAIGQPVMGKVGDQLGRKNIFLIGLLLVALSALSAPWAPTFLILILARLIQSFGSCSIYPSGMGMIREYITEKQASALAIISLFATGSAAFGPTIGGFLIDLGDWPAIFTVNIPVILISLLLGWFYLPPDRDKERPSFRQTVKQLDLPGILLFAASMVFLLWFLLSFKTQAHPLSGILGILLLAGFIYRELHVEKPFIQLRLFKTNPLLSWVYLQFIVLNIYNYSIFFGLPTYFQEAMNLDVKTSGLLMLFNAGFGALIYPVMGKWIDRSGVKTPLIISSFLMVGGALLLTFVFVHLPLYGMAFALAIMGLSYGITNVCLQSALLMVAPPSMTSLASGLFQTCRYMGCILSSVLLGLVFGTKISPGHLQWMGYALIVSSLASVWMSLKFNPRQD